MKSNKIQYAITIGCYIPLIIKAESIASLLVKLPKRLSNWETIQWRNSEGQRIRIDRECFDESGWTIQEMIDDWLTYSSVDEQNESIMCMKPRGNWDETIEI